MNINILESNDKKIYLFIAASLAIHLLIFAGIAAINTFSLGKTPKYTEITVVGIKTQSKYVPETMAKKNFRFTPGGYISRNIPLKKVPRAKGPKLPSFTSSFNAKFEDTVKSAISEKNKQIGVRQEKNIRPSKSRVFTPELKNDMALMDRFTKRKAKVPAPAESVGNSSNNKITSNIIWLTGTRLNRRLLYKPALSYPAEALKKVAVGSVKLKFKVTPDGKVIDVVPILKSDQVLTNYAIYALRMYKFEPLPDNITQITQEGKILFDFRLTGTSE